MEESFNWLKPIIASCTNAFHLEGCKILLKLFADKHSGDELFASAYNELYNDLNERITFLKIDV